MKIGGKELTGSHEELILLQRGDEVIPLKARAVLDFDAFNKMCPEPKAPGKRTKDGIVPDTESETYQIRVIRHGEQRLAYLIINSLQDIEWDTVKVEDPSTWSNYLQDLRKAGCGTMEINRIIRGVMQANSLDESKLEKAREVFLRGQPTKLEV